MKSKWVAAVLITSVALNLALTGFLVGSRSLHGTDFDLTRAYPRWARSLPESRREVLRPVIVKHMRAMRPKVRSLRQQHSALQNAIRTEPFDSVALQAALAKMREKHGRMQQTSHASFVEFVAELTPVERQRLVLDLGKTKRHGGAHKRRPRLRNP